MRDLNEMENVAVETKFDPVAAEKKYKVNPLEEIKEPPAVISIVDDSGREIPSMTRGSFSLMIGKAKSKKTFLCVLTIASYLGYKNDRIKGHPKDRPRVLWFDTEMSPYHINLMLKRVCRILREPDPVNLDTYTLRTCTTDERLKLIEYTIKSNPTASLVVIDGIRDLVYDINSPEEATATATRLMKWSAENDIHIINVLHQNKGDNNARGHLGTELVNKAESVLSVEVSEDPATSVVTAEYTRDIEFKPFSFTVNDDSLPEFCQMPERKEQITFNNPKLIPDDNHLQVLDQIYKRLKELPNATDLKDMVMSAFNYSFGEKKSRDYLNYYFEKGWITKMQNGHKVFCKYERAIF